MKIVAYDRFKPGVTLGTVKPYLRDEVSNIWRLWKAGIVRENYARADQPGVVIIFECDSVETVRRYVDDFPLSKAGLLEWDFIAFDAPLPLEFLFDPQVDLTSLSIARREKGKAPSHEGGQRPEHSNHPR
jgi:hypothetical protein